MNPATRSQPRVAVLSLVIVCIIVFCYIVYFFARGPIYQALYSLDLVPKPERFTELYFQNASELPSYEIKGEPISFSFTVHNEEGTSTVYPYVVSFTDAQGDQTTLEKNSVTLADNASTTIPISYLFRSSYQKGTVTVNLTSLNQHIDFLLSNATSTQ